MFNDIHVIIVIGNSLVGDSPFREGELNVVRWSGVIECRAGSSKATYCRSYKSETNLSSDIKDYFTVGGIGFRGDHRSDSTEDGVVSTVQYSTV